MVVELSKHFWTSVHRGGHHLLVGIGHHRTLPLEVHIPLSGNHLAFAPAIPLLKIYPKDTLLKIRIAIGLFIMTFWSGKTGNDLGVCQLRLGSDGVELSPSAKEWMRSSSRDDRISRVKWQVEKRTRWRVKSCSVLTFIYGRVGMIWTYMCLYKSTMWSPLRGVRGGRDYWRPIQVSFCVALDGVYIIIK